ncbi:MAG TPA: TIGR03619 family F420-dependent LLM class oxidoreductase [Acidimicrobiales bacterium]|nr:TIGR03619 family F420-dependent LLM class oxidoreductase [Acidimicrobiales bacterium]
MRFHQAVTFLPVDQGLALARAADAQGYAGVYVSDHMFFPRERTSRYTYSTREDGAPGFGDHWDPDTHWPDPWCFISAMAATTTRLHFTTGVYVAPARDLITVAKQVGTTAALSAGRVHLGVGVGWSKEEFDATGQDFHTRGKRLDDMIPALRALLAGGWVEYHGAHYDVPAMRMEPSPPSPVPIYGGGHSDAAFRRSATLCDGWIAAGAYKPEEAEEHLGRLHQARRAAGREDEPFAIFLSLWARPDLDVYRSFEERFGVTDFLCAPGLTAHVDAAATPEAQLQARLDASARFAEEIVARAAD